MTRETQKLSLKETMPAREYELLQMLTYKRKAWSAVENAFISTYILPLDVEEDDGGNYWKTVGENSPILWSGHTDTVHRVEGYQKVFLSEDGMAFTEGNSTCIGADGVAFTKDTSNCLGADDTTGIWIMRHMILAGVPGTYVFHGGEESGGIGSHWAAKNKLDFLKQFKTAIAFDRRDTYEIITHQSCGRTASDAFAESLATALQPLQYSASDGGTFTDTASYVNIIPECTNIGVGYYRQHTPKEYQDINHASALLDQLLVADFSGLVFERDPSAKERKTYYLSGSTGKGNNYGGLYTDGDYEGYQSWWDKAAAVNVKTGNDVSDDEGLRRLMGSGHKQITQQSTTIYQAETAYRNFTIADYCREYPDEIEVMLLTLGITVEEVEDCLYNSVEGDNNQQDNKGE